MPTAPKTPEVPETPPAPAVTPGDASAPSGAATRPPAPRPATKVATEPTAGPATESATGRGDGPEAAPARRRAGRGLLADITPLREHPAYRRLWFGLTVSGLGQYMTSIAVSVQVYEITGSSFAVGLVGLCGLLPLIVFGLYGGAIADSADRRVVGLVSAVGLAAMSVAFAVQAVLDLRQVWLLYVIVALQAAFFAVNNPARAAMIPRLVPAAQLPAANALSSMAMSLGSTVGPMLGGLVIGLWGFQAAYLIDVLTFGAALYAMWRLPSMPPERAEGARRRASVLDGLRFLRGRPNLRMVFLTDIVAMVLASPRALFPAMALLYGGGPGTVGLLAAAPAVGSLAGALFSGRLGGVHRQGRAVIVAVAAWGVAIAAFGLGGPLWLGLLFLAAAGCADTVSMVFRNTIMQVETPDAMRGRLSGVFVVVVAGGPRLGDFEAGSVASLIGERSAVIAGGLACMVLIALLALYGRGFWRYDGRAATTAGKT